MAKVLHEFCWELISGKKPKDKPWEPFFAIWPRWSIHNQRCWGKCYRYTSWDISGGDTPGHWEPKYSYLTFAEYAVKRLKGEIP